MRYPEKLYPHDIPHIGAFCKRLRLSRGYSASDLADFCEVRASTITRNFEESGTLGERNFGRLVAAFKAGGLPNELGYQPLTDEHAHQLADLYAQTKAKELMQRQARLSHIDIDYIRTRKNRNPHLTELVELLEREQRPAFIMDELWFLHALNGALLRLLTIDPQADHFHRWEQWHVIGSKLYADSPVRAAHENPDLYYPPAIAYFFNDTIPHFFTYQMRVVLKRMHELSALNHFHFDQWWSQATLFNLGYELKSLARILTYQGEKISTETSTRVWMDVATENGSHAKYTLVVWNPVNRDALHAFSDIFSFRDSKNIYYAADASRTCGKPFHVNQWPEVDAEILAWLKNGNG